MRMISRSRPALLRGGFALLLILYGFWSGVAPAMHYGDAGQGLDFTGSSLDRWVVADGNNGSAGADSAHPHFSVVEAVADRAPSPVPGSHPDYHDPLFCDGCQALEAVSFPAADDPPPSIRVADQSFGNDVRSPLSSGPALPARARAPPSI